MEGRGPAAGPGTYRPDRGGSRSGAVAATPRISLLVFDVRQAPDDKPDVRIYVARHSTAVDEGPGVADEDRYLSAAGRERARAVAQRLRDLDTVVDAVLTSPLVRAVQTGEILAAGIGFSGVIHATSALAPGAPPEVLVPRLAALGDAVLVVGHEPTISRFPQALGAPGFVPFAPAQVALIDGGRVAWWLDPASGEIGRR